MSRSSLVACLGLAALALACPRPLSADTIILRNGQELHGRVTIEGAKARVELDVGATLTIDAGEIAKTVVEAPATTVTGDAVAVSPELMARLEAREKTHLLIEQLLEDKEAVRQKAEAELIQQGRQALPMVRSAFASATAVQRRHLLHVLGAVGDPASVPRITELLREPNAKDLHVDAARALADIVGHDAVLLLTDLLVNAKEADLRTECLRALGELRDPFAAPFIVDALRDPALRQAARAALQGWHDPELLPWVLPGLDEGAREAQVRAATWAAALITPAHALTFTKILDAYKDNKEVAKALFPGVQHLHKDFGLVGDIELLEAPQTLIKSSALDSLHKATKDKKRGATARDWQAERDAATQPHLVLAPIARVNRALLREIATDLETSLKTPGAALQVKVEVGFKAVALPGPDERRCDGRPLLARLDAERVADPQAVRVIGLTSAELSMPGLDAALAPTRPGGSIAVSIAGLGEVRDDTVRRARRLLLHALARSLDLPPCTDQTCPSSALYAAGDLDAKSSRYCAACKTAFTAAWDAERDVAAYNYGAAAGRFAAIGARAKSAFAHAEAACYYERALQPVAAIEQWKAYQALVTDPALAALITKRTEMLDRADKWLTKKKVGPPDAPPRRRGRPQPANSPLP